MRHQVLVGSGKRGFTLIELLVVIAIVGLLAALVFPLLRISNERAVLNRVQTELAQVETAIALYHDDLGYYPPDNPANPALNQLYFELTGVTVTNGVCVTSDGRAHIALTDLGAPPPRGFGSAVNGIANIRLSANDERKGGKNYLGGLAPAQLGEMAPGVYLVCCSVHWPATVTPVPTPQPLINPWR